MTLLVKRAHWFGIALVLLVWVAMSLGESVAATAAADHETIWAGSSDGFAVRWRIDRLDVTQAGKLVLSFGALAEREWSQVRKRAEGRTLTLEKTYAVLSDVGPWLSVQEGSFCDCGGAHPSAVQRFRTYDLRKSQRDRGALAGLAAVFPQDTVLAALLNNELVVTALKDGGMETPRTLPDLIEALAFKTIKVRDCSYLFESDFLSSFAFRHISDDMVTLRLGLPSDGEVCRGELTQIEILLPIPESLREQYSTKGVAGALLMEQAKEVGAGRTTTFTFSSKPK